MKPQISITTFFNYDIPISEQIPMISKAGFTHVSLGGNLSHFNYLDSNERLKLKEVLKKYSLKVDTVHGCTADSDNSLEKLKGAVEAAHDLGAEVVVSHLSQFFIKPDQVEANVTNALKVCEKLEPIAEKYDIRFALENVHPGSATVVLRRVLPELNEKYFGFCYDSSHDQIDGPVPFKLLEQFGDRIFAVHMSDRIKV
ncbi:MAG: sugar phosphate isomerase/epimerase [Candidatus Delongbacteria bacterium]|jgi:sugar phosphate isomerase/epimerase|nr:sugar phosphate isomerase/epimerase [Candidatus Delongbacteria bacterium]